VVAVAAELKKAGKGKGRKGQGDLDNHQILMVDIHHQQNRS
jgi:hypothetical protein